MRPVPDLAWMIWTAWLEAEGEGPTGMALVAWVIRNRMRRVQASAHAVVLAPAQFSGWTPPRLAALPACTGFVWERSAAAVEPVWAAPPESDPTHGATHFLNVDLVRRLQGRLPPWAAAPDDPQRLRVEWVTLVAGRHTFLCGPVVPRPAYVVH